MSLEPVRKGCPLSPFSQTSSVVPWAISSRFTWSNNNTGKKIIIITRLDSLLNYLLGLSKSSIAASSFCLAFLLMWDPRQTFTKLVSCFVEYSYTKETNHSLVSSKQNISAQKKNYYSKKVYFTPQTAILEKMLNRDWGGYCLWYKLLKKIPAQG